MIAIFICDMIARRSKLIHQVIQNLHDLQVAKLRLPHVYLLFEISPIALLGIALKNANVLPKGKFGV